MITFSHQQFKQKILPSLLLAALLLVFTACSSKLTEPTISNTKLFSRAETEKMALSSTFTPQTAEIVIRFDLIAPSYPFKVLGRLFYLTEQQENYLVVEGRLSADYAGTHDLAITKPDKGWPQGNYKIELAAEAEPTEPLAAANFIVL